MKIIGEWITLLINHIIGLGWRVRKIKTASGQFYVLDKKTQQMFLLIYKTLRDYNFVSNESYSYILSSSFYAKKEDT